MSTDVHVRKLVHSEMSTPLNIILLTWCTGTRRTGSMGTSLTYFPPEVVFMKWLPPSDIIIVKSSEINPVYTILTPTIMLTGRVVIHD